VLCILDKGYMYTLIYFFFVNKFILHRYTETTQAQFIITDMFIHSNVGTVRESNPRPLGVLRNRRVFKTLRHIGCLLLLFKRDIEEYVVMTESV
jgi:hypothetical protein